MIKLEKSMVVQIGMVIYAIGSLLFQFSPDTIIPLLLTATFIKGIGFGYVGIMIFSMIADCVDYGTYLTGKQQCGIIFSAAIQLINTHGINPELVYETIFHGFFALAHKNIYREISFIKANREKHNGELQVFLKLFLESIKN